jgi:signal transduction histidine kinase
MRTRVLSMLMRPTSPPRVVGIVVAAALIAAETLVVYPLDQVAPPVSLGMVYLVGVLVVSSVWGLTVGVVTAVLSTAVYDFFHVPPSFTFAAPSRPGQAAVIILLLVALLFSFVAALARSQAIDADERRRDADLAADMARLLLRTENLRSALPGASARLARALGLSSAAIELEAVAGDERRAAFPLRDGGTRLGTLLVPAELPHRTEVRVRERVVPSVEALLRAAREREAIGSALEASRDELVALAEEQAALRRVATLVAGGAKPEEVFAAVTEEVGQLLLVDYAGMARYEPDGMATAVAARGTTHFPVGSSMILGGKNTATLVFETGRPVRIDGYADASGPMGHSARERGVHSSVAAPIIVEGRLWGTIGAGSAGEQPLPPDTEARLADFTELVATAIANAESRAALAASRARIVAAADESRRRIERDLHDGAQQRLVHAVIVLKLALRALSNADANAEELVAEALRHAEQANAELRELAHGILPAALTRGGLRAGVEALVSRVSLPVRVDVPVVRLPAGVEATAYFVISEALTNVVKHAHAAGAGVTARVENGQLRVEVRDDGIGGARGGDSTGLGGLEDRVSAQDGRLVLESPPGEGTRVCALLPVPSQD